MHPVVLSIFAIAFVFGSMMEAMKLLEKLNTIDHNRKQRIRDGG